MTRRHHTKKKRRVRSNSNNHPDEHSGGTSLEEDLRQQRIRQQERDAQEKEQQQEDTKRQAEERRLRVEEQQREQESQEIWSERVTPQKLIWKGLSAAVVKDGAVSLPISFALGHVHQSSSLWQGHERRKLIYLWQSKHLLDNMTINSRAFLMYSIKYKWADRVLPDGSHSSWDLSCKHRLHPTARTFDVANLREGNLLTITSIVEGGWSLLNGYQEEIVHVQRSIPVDSMRLHESTGRVGLLRQTANVTSPDPFLLYDLNGDIKRVLCSSSFDGIPINDLCFGQDLVLFAGPRRYQGKDMLPLLLPLSPQGDPRGVRELNIQNMSESDVLRLEMTCKHDPIIGFGHRNGQVSILDLRESTSVCSILHCEESSSSSTAGIPLGSVTDLSFLSSLETQKVLVRRSHGTCQLHDLRTSSISESVCPHLSSSSTLLLNMRVPFSDINPTLTARCSGVALDPLAGQTLIAPYVSTDNDAYLGVWSMKTGLMVGSRLLKVCNSLEDSVYVELCQKITPSFVTSKPAGCSYLPSSFSVWAKCGAHSKREVGSKVGTLYQVSFPGHWK
ncbi:hypothetical protein IV203_031610 [Nitzschia inconspicua]|uniref:Uncharacterized protein n=1 Tax=Nitzschia inconspicua TaxID=303405 RepID=A0A9K3K5G2_9STRA|nr:hypothetical protein IV203_011169 [Nitzschia inconspicua]KAG7368867.1 hypothetical protein IV203_031610 [Nitzschia inconspicua]